MELVTGTGLLLLLLGITIFYSKLHKSRGQLPPGPTPWPFLGNLLQKDAIPLHKSFPKLQEKYGPVFTIWMGPKPMVVLSGYDAVKEALTDHDEGFSGRPSIPILEQISKGYGLIGPDHKKWKELRRFTLSTLRNFGMGKKPMIERIQEEANYLVETISAKQGQAYDILPDLTAAASNVICSVVFGSRFSYKDPVFTELLRIIKDFVGFFMCASGTIYSAIPRIMNLLPGPHQKCIFDCAKVCSFVREKVESHKLSLDPHNPGDFIDCFLLKLQKDQNSGLICTEDLVMTVLDLFLAGTDTTSSSLIYGLLIVSKLPHIQAKIQQEIDEVVGQNRPPNMEDRVKMPFTNAVIHEVQRYQRGSAESFPHMTTQDVKFRGYTIPEGTIVFPLFISVHFDPDYWKNPEEFDPGHFLNAEGEFQKKDAYMPFSADENEEATVFPLKKKKKKTQDLPLQTSLASPSVTFSATVESYLSSEKSDMFGHINLQRQWSEDSEQLSESTTEVADGASGSEAPISILKPVKYQKAINVNKYKDFIRCLPIHLSKYILRMLDLKSLIRCANVSMHWNLLVKQIRKDLITRRSVQSEISFLQASCPKGAVANYAKIVKVAVPQINKDGDIIPRAKNKLQTKETEHLIKAYHGQETSTVLLEERNVFCSGYNVQVLIDSLDPNRVVHYNNGKLLAIGSADRKVRFFSLTDLKYVPPLITGHAGSIRALYLNEQKGFVLSGSYDLSIRMWNASTGACVKIFNGHTGSITCLDLFKNKIISGSRDCTAKMWDIETGKCIKTFGHKGIVWAAKMNSVHVVSCCDVGQVKVWHVESLTLIKTLEGHLGPVKCLAFDDWHLVTGGNDGYILGWSMLGKHKRCLVAFRHPMEVLHLGFLYLRVISGCADGKIRIFNFLTGICLRVMRANSRGDPVMSLCIVENKLVINAQGSVVLFRFEAVKWDLEASEKATKKRTRSKFSESLFQIKPSIGPSHSDWKQHIRRKSWKLYATESDPATVSYFITHRASRASRPALHYEVIKAPPSRRKVASEIMLFDKKRLSRIAKSEKAALEESSSLITLTGSSVHQIKYEVPAPVSTLEEHAEAFIEYVKQRGSLGPVSKDRVLLAVSTMQHAYNAYKNDPLSANMAYNMKIKDAWGPTVYHKEQPKKILAPQSPMQQEKADPSAQLERLKASGGTLGMERISTPYETKALQLRLKNSLLGSNVKSFIPAPTLTRSKSCSILPGDKKSPVKAKMPSTSATGEQLIGHFTTSAEPLKVPRMKIGQPNKALGVRQGKVFFIHSPNPYRVNTGFSLRTTQQIKEYGEAKLSEYQATKTKVIADFEKARKNAWLRKIKGLPIDDFMKEGKIAAPELGEDVYI